jgi:hypothetical protein
MAWFVFDMDETLGHLHTPYHMLCVLKTKEHMRNRLNNASDPLKEALHRAYRRFVDGVAGAESSATPLGILRPGMLDIFHRLVHLQKQGIIGGTMIYSNNAHLPSVKFIQDVLNTATGSNIVCDAIHLLHPDRKPEQFTQGGRIYANKTWDVVKHILQTGSCGAPESITPKDVYFVDDQKHPDLERVLGTHYIRAPQYKYKTRFNVLLPFFEEALRSADLTEDPGFTQLANYIKGSCTGFKPTSYHNLITTLRSYTPAPPNPVPLPDSLLVELTTYLDGIESMSNVANNHTYGANTATPNLPNMPLSNINSSLFKGGRRRKTSKKRNLHKNRTRWLRRQQ